MSDSLYPTWTTDEKHVYCAGGRIRADRKSFRILNEVFAKDDTRVFTRRGALRDADAVTFEVLGTYLHPVEQRFHSYGRDRRSVFFHAGMGQPRLLKSADPASFRWLGAGYGGDAKRVYLAGYLVEKADPATFRPQKRMYATDAARCFYGTKWIPNLDPATFSVLELGGRPLTENDQFARDARRVVYRDRELAGADAATFVLEPLSQHPYWAACDKNRSWSATELSALCALDYVQHKYPSVVIPAAPSAARFNEDKLSGMEMQIITFCSVVHHRSAENAAKQGRWVYTPATIRRHIEELQAKLGVRLAELDDERISVTPDGLALYKQLGAPVDLFAALASALDRASGRG